MTKILIAAPIVLAPLFWYSYDSGLIAKVQGYDSKSFDNSKPGLWKATVSLSSETDKQMNGNNKLEVCADQKMIDEANKSTLEEKLFINSLKIANLKCENKSTRISKSDMKIDLICQGNNAMDNKITVNLTAKGNIQSTEEKTIVQVDYEVNNGVNKPSSFTMKTEAERTGDCKK